MDDGWLAILYISVVSRQYEGDNEKLGVVEPYSFLPPTEFCNCEFGKKNQKLLSYYYKSRKNIS